MEGPSGVKSTGLYVGRNPNKPKETVQVARLDSFKTSDCELLTISRHAVVMKRGETTFFATKKVWDSIVRQPDLPVFMVEKESTQYGRTNWLGCVSTF